MNNTIQPGNGHAQSLNSGLWTRLRETPLSDAIRGQLTRALNIDLTVAGFALPEHLHAFVLDVTKRTKLWRSEQIEVAKELAGHFRDGLDAGATEEHLIKRFGEPAQVAKMIRRARMRCRPLHWQIRHYGLIAITMLFGVMLVSYGVLAVRFFTASPTISRNYFEEINTAAKSIPEENRAWPFYREAYLSYEQPSEEWYSDWTNHRYFTPDTASEQWQRLVDHVEQHRDVLRLIHQGAERDQLGYVYGDPENREFIQRELQRETDELTLDQSLVYLTLSQTQSLRSLARLLYADGLVGAVSEDGDRVARDIGSLISIAEHARGNGLFIEELVAYAIFHIAAGLTSDALVDHPASLTDEQLVEIANRFSDFAGGGTLRASTKSELWWLEDLLQRSFTDDGNRDGRLTPEGLRLLEELSGSIVMLNEPSKEKKLTELLHGPAAMALIGSRRENYELAERLMSFSVDDFSGPLYTWKEPAYENELKSLANSLRTRMLYAPILLFLPAVQQVALSGERVTQKRDGILTAIALELYHREYGIWPRSLDELVPRYLPQVPLDRVIGEAIHFKIENDRPVVYSAGADRMDDGGRMPTTADEDTASFQIGHADIAGAQGFDWILFPRYREQPRVDATE